jgi:alpha-1,2-mannosyltransferase
VATAAPGEAPDFDRHFRRALWAVTGVIAVAAAIVHSAKAADERSAFIRWRPQVLDFWQGINIYETHFFPNPPMMPITLSPLMALPPVVGATCWFALKVALTAASVWLCFRIVRRAGRPLPSWFQAGVLVFSLRPFLSDLHHGNNNLLILFLIVAALEAWRKGYDVLAGLILALSISYKVTPALFVFYFLLKGSWRAAGATVLGIGVFLLIVPSLVIGPRFNAECLGMWWHHMLSPFLTKGASSPQEINQSMVGVLTRLLTATKTGDGRYDVHMALNLVSWPPAVVGLIVKGVSVLLLGLLAFFCRTKAARRDDPRLLGEFALVVLTMLFLSERSWKHHFVTLLLPYTYLMAEFAYRGLPLRSRVGLAAAMWGSVLLMATTSTELGGLFAHHQGHKIAQGYGMFLWAAVLLYLATAWRVVADRNHVPKVPKASISHAVPAPHFADAARAAAAS